MDINKVMRNQGMMTDRRRRSTFRRANGLLLALHSIVSSWKGKPFRRLPQPLNGRGRGHLLGWTANPAVEAPKIGGNAKEFRFFLCWYRAVCWSDTGSFCFVPPPVYGERFLSGCLGSVVEFGLFERFDGVLIRISFLGYVMIWFSEVKNELDNSRMNLILRIVSFGAPRPHIRRLRSRVGNRPIPYYSIQQNTFSDALPVYIKV